MSREWARKQILQSLDFKATANEALEYINGFQHCMIGGLAVAHYANPPVTVDVDFLVISDRNGLSEIGLRFKEHGWSTAPLWFTSRRKGFPNYGLNSTREKPLASEVDLLATGSDRYLQSVVTRSVLVEYQPGLRIMTIRAEDLVVMKSLAGRDKDHEDVAEIVKAMGDSLDVKYIDAKLEELL